jgi:hypothetical protein
MNWFVTRQLTLAGAFALIGVIGGCSGGSSGPRLDPGKQATITGSVTFNGQPLPLDSSVYFSSKDTGTTAAGKLDALGNFSATAPDPKQGLSAGRYHIMVRPPTPPPVTANDPRYKDVMTGGAKPSIASSDSALIPKQFFSLETTKLVLEVKPGPNTFNIDLAKIK